MAVELIGHSEPDLPGHAAVAHEELQATGVGNRERLVEEDQVAPAAGALRVDRLSEHLGLRPEQQDFTAVEAGAELESQIDLEQLIEQHAEILRRRRSGPEIDRGRRRMTLVRAYNHRRQTIGPPRLRQGEQIQAGEALKHPENQPPEPVVRVEEVDFGGEIQGELRPI
jgi:hypothetical protein